MKELHNKKEKLHDSIPETLHACHAIRTPIIAAILLKKQTIISRTYTHPNQVIVQAAFHQF
ncbi:MAG: hypothetical protein ACJAUD_000190 [Crocinitomicaceae bacterium]